MNANLSSGLLAVALLALLAAPAMADTVKPWQGARTVVKARHLAPAMRKGGDYWDKYTFNANLGEKGTFYFSLAIGDPLSADKKLDCKGRLTFEDKTYRWDNDFRESAWSHTSGDTSKITAGRASLESDGEKLTFRNETDGMSYEFEFTPIARPWRPKSGQIQFGADKNAYDVTLFPLMQVKGKVKLAGGEWTPVDGRGFGSHVWGDLAPYDMFRWSLEFRGLSGDYTVYLRELGTTVEFGQTRIPYLLITKGKDVLVESFDFQFAPTEVTTDEVHENKYKVPHSFTLIGKDAEDPTRQFRAVVKMKKQNKRKDYLEGLNFMTKGIAARFSKPVLYDYDTDFTFEVKTSTGLERIVQGVDLGRLEINWLNQ